MKRGKRLLQGLIVLCSLSFLGCKPDISVSTGMYCPKPEKPELPFLTDKYFLDAPVNIEILMQRDDMIRLYIDGLEETIRCYENSQGLKKGVKNEPKRSSHAD